MGASPISTSHPERQVGLPPAVTGPYAGQKLEEPARGTYGLFMPSRAAKTASCGASATRPSSRDVLPVALSAVA